MSRSCKATLQNSVSFLYLFLFFYFILFIFIYLFFFGGENATRMNVLPRYSGAERICLEGIVTISFTPLTLESQVANQAVSKAQVTKAFPVHDSLSDDRIRIHKRDEHRDALPLVPSGSSNMSVYIYRR